MPTYDHIVVDVEVQHLAEEFADGWDATDQLGVGVAVVYEFRTGRYLIYGPDDVERLQDRLECATRISGFNIWKFDFPVIWGVPTRQPIVQLAPKTNDILARIWCNLGLPIHEFTDLHHGWGLDNVCKYTIRKRKTGNGGNAPKLFQTGQWPKLIEYCIDDVRLEKN